MSHFKKQNSLIKTLNKKAKEENLYLVTRLQKKRQKNITALDDHIESISNKNLSGIGLHIFDQKGHSVLLGTDDIENSKKIAGVFQRGKEDLNKLGEKATKNTEVFDLPVTKKKLEMPKDFQFNKYSTEQVETILLKLNKKLM